MISLKSNITRTLLNYFFINPDESLYVNELSRKLQLDKRNLLKKLRQLENQGILKSQQRGNLKLYSINKQYTLYSEYKKIMAKTVGLEAKLKDVIMKIPGVKQAYIYGSYAKDTMDVHSDIDLLVIGEHKIVSLQSRLDKIQQEIEREINVVNMEEKEFKKRIRNKNPLVSGIMKNKHIRIV